MQIHALTAELSVSPQIATTDMEAIRAAGFRTLVCNRPDGEASDQTLFSEIKQAAEAAGIEACYLPVESGKVGDEQGRQFAELYARCPKPVLAYCRTGMRSATLWALSQADKLPLAQIIGAAADAGYDLKGVVRRIVNGGRTPLEVAEAEHEVVIVGGGAAGIAVAASLLTRSPGLDIALVDPADVHYYQPGWTMVQPELVDATTAAKQVV